MASKHGSNGTKSLFEGITEAGRTNQEEKHQTSKKLKNKNIKEQKSKRSYELKNSTIKKLQELKVFDYTDPDVTYNEIVDESINLLYNQKHKAE